MAHPTPSPGFFPREEGRPSLKVVERLRAGKGRTKLPTEGALFTSAAMDQDCRVPPGSPEFQIYTEIIQQQIRGGLGRKLGCGTWGCAYRAKGDPGRVIKITGDRAEVAAAHNLLTAIRKRRASWSDFPALARIYDVYGVLDLCGWPLPVFVIVQENIPEDPPAELDGYLTESSPDGKETWWRLVEAGWGRTGRVPADLLRRARDFGLPAEEVRSLVATIHALRQVPISWHDLHAGNVRADGNGRWKIIDLGVSVTLDTSVPIIKPPKPEDEQP